MKDVLSHLQKEEDLLIVYSKRGYNILGIKIVWLSSQDVAENYLIDLTFW